MLSDAQKASIRLYLGYPDFFRFKHTRLESVLSNLSSDAETLIISALASITSVETALLEAGVDEAGVKRVDEIWFDNGWRRAVEVRKTGRMFVGRISIITGVPIYSDVFGTGGYLGDSFSGLGGPRERSGFYGLG